MNLRGHFWTLTPFVRYSLAPPRAPESTPWETRFRDEVVGELALTGALSKRAADTVVVIVHGLGGSAASYYALLAAQAAARAGIDSLRLNLRGADRCGGDFYHAGLTDDLEATLLSPTLQGYRRVLLLGYSLGGNMVLRYLSEQPDSRVTAGATICSPIDLASSAREIDRPKGTLYRRHVLRALKEIYRHVAERRTVHLPVREAVRIDQIERWDDEVIAPRHGFAGAEDYWAKTSACFSLSKIDTPTLVVASEHDPMVGSIRSSPG